MFILPTNDSIRNKVFPRRLLYGFDNSLIKFIIYKSLLDVDYAPSSDFTFSVSIKEIQACLDQIIRAQMSISLF